MDAVYKTTGLKVETRTPAEIWESLDNTEKVKRVMRDLRWMPPLSGPNADAQKVPTGLELFLIELACKADSLDNFLDRKHSIESPGQNPIDYDEDGTPIYFV